jgi:hypothetical protein
LNCFITNKKTTITSKSKKIDNTKRRAEKSEQKQIKSQERERFVIDNKTQRKREKKAKQSLIVCN